MFPALVLALMSAVACTSSSGTTSTGRVEPAFIAAANQACEPFLDQSAQVIFPYPSFAATDPLVTQLPAAGQYYDSLPINHQELALMRAVGTPHRGAQTWKDFLDLIGREQSLVAQQIASAKASDKGGFVSTVNQIADLTKQIDEAATAVGFASDDSCTQLFG
jgi:hypothetical protein